MEKTKSELYMERLQKWREEKRKGKENKMRQVTKRSPKQLPKQSVPRVKPGLKGLNMKPVCKPVKALDKPTTVAGNRKPGQMALKPVNSSSTVKSTKKRKSEDSREMLSRLNQWKEEKSKSERKQPPLSVSKSKPTDKPHKTIEPSKANQIKVKSRLFDYLNKPKQNRNHPASKITNTGQNQARKNSCGNARLTFDAKQGKVQKAELKRRHSEVTKDIKQKKPGILKRKSCIGMFDLTDNNNIKSSPKRRRTSCNTLTSTSPLITKKDSTVARKEDKVVTMDMDSDSCTMPSEAVTPGFSTRNVRFTTPPGSNNIETKKWRKTPKTPATRKAELDAWLKAKGRTPSKFRHLMCFHGHGKEHSEDRKDPHTKNMLSIDELSEQMDVLEQERLLAEVVEEMNSMLDECMILFEAGCPVESIVPWLDDIYKQIPVSHMSARFYTCKANVIKSTLDLDAVLEVFEQATINNAQPKEDIAKCLTETLKFVTEGKVRQAKKRSRTPRRSYIQEENIFESSSVVYTVANVTPFSEGKRSSKRSRTQSQCQVVTPVRRSTRRSLQNLPESLKDSKRSYSNLDDVEDKANVLFQPNKALDDVFASMEDE